MKRPGSLHYAKLESSPRLQRALASLREHPKGLTTRQWIDRADICACNSVAAELRKNGYNVTCGFEGRSPTGSSVFRYRLVEAP